MKKILDKNKKIFVKCFGILVQPATLALAGPGAQLIAQGSIYALSDILAGGEKPFPDVDTVLAGTKENIKLDSVLILDQFDNKKELYEDISFDTAKIACRITNQWCDNHKGQYSDSDLQEIQSAILKYLNEVQRWKLSNTTFLQDSLRDYSDKINDLQYRVEKNENVIQLMQEQKKDIYELQGKESYNLGETFGRESYISLIDNYLSKKQVVLLWGEPGIGKTQLASYYADKRKEEYNVIFTKYSTNIQDLVCEQFSISDFSERNTNEETIEHYYKRTIKEIKHRCNNKTLIILDNFDVKTDTHLKEFLSLKCKIIITSRNELDGIPSIRVRVLEKEELRKMFAFYRFGNTSDTNKPEDLPIIDEILDEVQFHTYAIELIAKQIKASHISPEEMLDKLKKGEIDNDSLKESIDARGDRKPAFRHICALYRIGELQEEEKYILRCLSLMGVGGTYTKHFFEWLGLNTYDCINSLHDRGWIRFDSNEETEKCSLHPLAIDVIHHSDLKPDETNCEVFLENIQKYLVHTWRRTYTENLKIERNILSITRYFSSPDVSKLHLFNHLSSFLWQIGRFDEAIEYDKKLYDRCEHFLGMKSLLTAIAARALAGSFFNSGQEENSIPYYKITLEIMRSINLVEGPDLALAYEKVARCYTWPYCKDLEMAEQYFNKAIDIRISNIIDLQNSQHIDGRWDSRYEEFNIDNAFAGFGGLLMEVGRFQQVKGNYNKALQYSKLYQIILEKYDRENLNGFSYAYYDQAFSWYKIGIKHESSRHIDEANDAMRKAKKYIDSAVEIIHERRGDRAVDTIECEVLYGDIYTSLGLYEDAAKMLGVAYNTSNKLVGFDNERTISIKEKLEKLTTML